MRSYFSLTGLVLLVAAPVLSQQHNFTVYSVEHGLAQSQVSALLQDRQGYLWAGTLGGGVSRFDGFEFTNLTTADGLAHDIVKALLEDREGRIWIGTRQGLSRWDGRELTNFTDGLPGSEVRSLAEAAGGSLWIGTASGLARFAGGGIETVATGEEVGVVHAVLEDTSGRLWLGTDRGLLRSDGADPPRFTAVPETMAQGDVYALLEDRQGRLWAGTDQGALRQDGEVFREVTAAAGRFAVKALLEDRGGNVWLATDNGGVLRSDGTSWRRFTRLQGLPSDTAWALLEDREGQVWIGTYRGGLCRYEGDRFVHYTRRDGLAEGVVRAIAGDRGGNLVFATDGGGVSFFDGRAFRHVKRADGLPHDFVLTVLEDRRGNLWLGTYRGLSRYDGRRVESFTAEGLGEAVVRALLEDQNGHLWIGTNDRGLLRYDGERFSRMTSADGLVSDSVMALHEDRQGRLWIATLNGLNRFDGAAIETVSSPYVVGKEVYSIAEDERGDLWLAVYGSGLLRFSPAGSGLLQDFDIFTRADGMNGHGVVSLVFDDAGDLWIGTEQGVLRLDVKAYRERGEKSFRFYGAREGFRGIECVHNAAYKDDDGKLWFGTIRGATRYDPLAATRPAVAPLLHLLGVRLFHAEKDLSRYALETEHDGAALSGLRLPHSMNHVTFDFLGVHLGDPEGVRYRVLLEGFDEGWIALGHENQATYSNLAHGRYVFHVQAESKEGAQSPTASYALTIERPFWKTLWFRLFGFLALASALVILHRWRLAAVERREAELEAKVEERAGLILLQKEALQRINAELKSFTHVVSHDLRSPLFTIKGFLKLVEKDLTEGHGEKARQDLTRIQSAADTMSTLLDDLLRLSRAGQVIFEPAEVALCELAYDVAQLLTGRIEERGVEIVIARDCPKVLGDRSRLHQVIQNLFENAIKFLGDQENPKIELTSTSQNDEVVFQVRDNGVGIDPADQEKVFGLFRQAEHDVEGSGVGLALVEKIIEVHGGRVWIESEGRGRGTRVCFTLPLAPSGSVAGRGAPGG